MKKSIEDLVDEWHRDINIKCSLQEYLGMTDTEYQIFLVGETLLREWKFSFLV